MPYPAPAIAPTVTGHHSPPEATRRPIVPVSTGTPSSADTSPNVTTT